LTKFILAIAISTYGCFSQQYKGQILSISPQVKQRMLNGNSWRKGCPVELIDLRYLRIPYINFYGHTKLGELIVHKDVAQSTIEVFKELYSIGYPIKQMKLVSNFKGNDWQSIEADNTSALNCRAITGDKKKWSNHAYGKAIDINPIENPYISRTGHISHQASIKYKRRINKSTRSLADKAVILKNDKTIKILKKNGWNWGGNWGPIKDYQHFEHITAKPSM
jgi:poly-gamma-glutamate synthesis protein (capsule biosynthesis protein)